jgi:protein-glutamine gamma-glutamyltransferase
MIPPPLLIGMALLFWGWMTGFLWVAVIMAVIVESARVVRFRWDFSAEDFQRIWTLCCLLFLGVAALKVLAGDSASEVVTGSPATRLRALREVSTTALTLTQWLPMFFFPLMAAQAFCVHPRVRVTVFFLFFRRRLERSWFQPEMNLGFPYLAISLISASAANVRHASFFIGMGLLVGWALWRVRPVRYSLATWVALAVVAAKLGYAGHEGLIRLHQYIEGKSSEWMSRFANRNANALENRTSIGRIGRTKLSGRIVLRVEPTGHPPHLLRETSYNNYNGGAWFTVHRDFEAMNPEADGESWKLLPPQPGSDVVYISQYLPGGRGIMAVPSGVTELLALPVGRMETNRYGVLKASAGPGLVRFRAHFAEGRTFDSRPSTNYDLSLLTNEVPALDEALAQMKLDRSTPPAEAVRTITRFFVNEFRYTTWLEIPRFNSETELTPVGQFLLKKRAGHCEYFATATVLLLRRLGIPARYASGFAVDELAKDGKTFLVRERHAHAWALVWMDGAWRDVDTTPGTWLGVEEKLASMEWFKDGWANLQYAFARWRWLKEEQTWQKILPWVLVLLLGFMGWRVGVGLRRQRQRRDIAKVSHRFWPGMDSEFFALQRRLREADLDWAEDETSAVWLRRVTARGTPRLAELLREIHRLHLRYRFDPAGVTATERRRLAELVQAAMAEPLDKLEPAGRTA